MSSNPIQRRTRNAFLLGMIIMLIVAIIVVVLLYFILFKNTMDEIATKKEQGTTFAYTLIAPVESGESISNSKIKLTEFSINDLPADYIYSPEIVEYKSKLKLQAGTILTQSLVYKDEIVNNSTRLMEYNMLTIPSTLDVGDYVDVRFTMTTGQDYIVLAKKEVKDINKTTISFYLTEDEILMMSSAIIESYIMQASNLYVNKYVEAGNQNASTPTYSINSDVYQLIVNNSQKGINIEDYAKINESYNTDLRTTIERELSKYNENKIQNIETGIRKQKDSAMELYLSGLSVDE